MSGPRSKLKQWVMDRYNDGRLPAVVVTVMFKVFNLKGL